MLDEKDWVRLKEVFVSKDECRKQDEENNRKFSADKERLAVIEAYQKLTLGILSAVGVGVLGILIEILFGGVV